MTLDVRLIARKSFRPERRSLALCLLTTAAPAALASDYAHNCISADGGYEWNDGALYARDDVSRTEIPYAPAGEERVLAERSGYCLSKGQRFAFQHKTYTMDVRIEVKGTPQTLRLECELASDGLPAASACEKEVVTVRTQPDYASPEQVSKPIPAGNVWMHNGSRVTLVSSGTARRFIYIQPRRGMAGAGAKPGDVVFEGERTGNVYQGTAYIFSIHCGKRGYAVEGTVSEDDRVVRMTGNAPLVKPDTCEVSGTKPDVLVFSFLDK